MFYFLCLKTISQYIDFANCYLCMYSLNLLFKRKQEVCVSNKMSVGSQGVHLLDKTKVKLILLKVRKSPSFWFSTLLKEVLSFYFAQSHTISK